MSTGWTLGNFIRMLATQLVQQPALFVNGR